MKPVTFPYGTIAMAGHLYLPPVFDSSKRYAAVVVAHPFGGVKEQTAGIYARKLAEQGFVALAFDGSHTGDSGGEPRYQEVPAHRINGIRSAVDYFTTLPFVNKERIGSLGVCAGGMYSVSTAATETRVKAVATVSMWDIADESRRGLLRTIPESDRRKRLREVSEQRAKRAQPRMGPHRHGRAESAAFSRAGSGEHPLGCPVAAGRADRGVFEDGQAIG